MCASTHAFVGRKRPLRGHVTDSASARLFYAFSRSLTRAHRHTKKKKSGKTSEKVPERVFFLPFSSTHVLTVLTTSFIAIITSSVITQTDTGKKVVVQNSFFSLFWVFCPVLLSFSLRCRRPSIYFFSFFLFFFISCVLSAAGRITGASSQAQPLSSSGCCFSSLSNRNHFV